MSILGAIGSINPKKFTLKNVRTHPADGFEIKVYCLCALVSLNEPAPLCCSSASSAYVPDSPRSPPDKILAKEKEGDEQGKEGSISASPHALNREYIYLPAPTCLSHTLMAKMGKSTPGATPSWLLGDRDTQSVGRRIES